jgi:hypothetical protein
MSDVFATTSTRPAASRVFAALLPIMAVVLVAFLVIGLSLPILPLHVYHRLGFARSLFASSSAANSRPLSSRGSGRGIIPTERGSSAV